MNKEKKETVLYALRIPLITKERLDVISHQLGWSKTTLVLHALETAFDSDELKMLARLEEEKRNELGVQL